MSKEKSLNIYQRINAVMKTVAYIEKGEKKVNGQYRFVSHDQVTGMLHKPLAENGIVMVPTVTGHEINGNRTEMKVSVRFVNMDEPTDFVEVSYIGYGIDAGDKGPGKAISYATKYALLKMFCLETGDDPDQDASSVHVPAATLSNEQVYELERLFNKFSDEKKEQLKNAIKTRFNSPNFAEIPKESFDRIKSYMNSEVKKQEEVLNEQVG